MDNFLDNYEYDKDDLKENISDDQMFDLLNDLGAEPQWNGSVILNKTICHCGNSHKLYYYPNTHLFKCYTDCGGAAWDIFELVRKVKSREHDKEYALPYAIDYVARYFGIAPKLATNEQYQELKDSLEYWEKLKEYNRIENINQSTQEIELKEYNGKFLKYMPLPNIKSWLDDGITRDAMISHEIRFDPVNCGVIIPHYDINNKLIGIRSRSLIKDDQARFGKYRPAYLNGVLYNHPLGFNLYNLNWAKDAIKASKKVIVAEGEKSCLQYESMFGKDNNICVACCGSSFIAYQAWLLINLGVEEIIIAFDKQYQEFGDNEHIKLVNNLKTIFKKYGHFVKITYMFDKEQMLDYKDSPFDKGKDTFMELYRKRVNLY